MHYKLYYGYIMNCIMSIIQDYHCGLQESKSDIIPLLLSVCIVTSPHYRQCMRWTHTVKVSRPKGGNSFTRERQTTTCCLFLTAASLRQLTQTDQYVSHNTHRSITSFLSVWNGSYKNRVYLFGQLALFVVIGWSARQIWNLFLGVN